MSKRLSPIKILIADGHAGMRRVIRHACGGLADEMIECESVEASANACLQHSPDWVILDLTTPPAHTFDAAQRILQQHSGTRIIVVSQLAGPELMEKFQQSGSIEFVGKEELATLVDIIRNSPVSR